MQYAIALAAAGACGDVRTLAYYARLAEIAGWEGIFLEDYLVWQNHPELPAYDPWMALTGMALATQQIRLGTQVTPLPRRRPWKLAREALTLDQVSGGRAILGVGLGDAADLSFTSFGEETDVHRKARAVDEALDVLNGLWSGEPFSYAGEVYRVQDAHFLPRPVRAGRIPIWVGGVYPHPGAIRRAARCDGACLYKPSQAGMQPEDIAALRASIERQRGSLDGFDIIVGGNPRRADWEAERGLIGAMNAAGATWWVEYAPPDEPGRIRERIERGPLRIEE